MDSEDLMKNIGLLATEILQTITARYVVGEKVIPEYVLKLKDEVMNIYAKSRKETNPDILSEYERRISEIKGELEKGEQL